MLYFYWRLLKRTPVLLWRSLTGLDKVTGALALVFGAVGLSAWQQLLPWWSPFAAFGVILFYGFLRANHEEYRAVEGERNILREGAETEEKRAAIGAKLQWLYNQGSSIRTQIIDSDDETFESECDEAFAWWRREISGYLSENVSAGKAQYVDGVPSVSAATIGGMKSHATWDRKETIVLHINERLKRLAEVMREY